MFHNPVEGRDEDSDGDPAGKEANNGNLIRPGDFPVGVLNQNISRCGFEASGQGERLGFRLVGGNGGADTFVKPVEFFFGHRAGEQGNDDK